MSFQILSYSPKQGYHKVVMVAVFFSAAMLSDSVSAVERGLVVRAGECSANAFIRGAEQVQGKGFISGLSVNCTRDTSDKNEYRRHLVGIEKYGQWCVATWEQIVRKGGRIDVNPIAGNAEHCKVQGYADELVKVFTHRQ